MDLPVKAALHDSPPLQNPLDGEKPSGGSSYQNQEQEKDHEFVVLNRVVNCENGNFQNQDAQESEGVKKHF